MTPQHRPGSEPSDTATAFWAFMCSTLTLGEVLGLVAAKLVHHLGREGLFEDILDLSGDGASVKAVFGGNVGFERLFVGGRKAEEPLVHEVLYCQQSVVGW